MINKKLTDFKAYDNLFYQLSSKSCYDPPLWLCLASKQTMNIFSQPVLDICNIVKLNK